MFQNPKEYIETHGLDSPPYEHFTACPMCGGNYVPYKRCDLCGNPIFDEYIMLKSGEVYCENCYCRKNILVKQFQEIEVSEESIAIAALFHDLCKANYYAVGTKNVKDELTGQWHKEPFYKAEDQFPVGHGEKSVIILLQYMKLTDEEIYAIRWHMSGFDSAVKGGDFGCSKAYDMCPFAVLLHLADMEATYLMEERGV